MGPLTSNATPQQSTPPVVTPKTNWFTSFLGSQGFHSFYHAVLAGGMGYISTNGIQPSKSWIFGLVAAALGGMVGWLNGKTSMFFIGFLLLTTLTPAYASNPIGVPLNPPAQGENDFLVMPFTNINTYTSDNTTNYGLGVAYGFAFANVTPASPNTANINPYFFIAPYASAEIANWVNSNGSEPWTVDYGLMLGLPRLDSAVPEVCITVNKNSTTGSATTIGIATAFPTDILSDLLVRKLN